MESLQRELQEARQDADAQQRGAEAAMTRVHGDLEAMEAQNRMLQV